MRLYFTVRHLRAEQIVYRLYYRLARGLVRWHALTPIPQISQRKWHQPWDAPRVVPRSYLGDGNFELLGLRRQVKTQADWNCPAMPKLWLYNLHYLDDLNAADSATRIEQQEGLIQRWIDDNPPMRDNGWEPYPLSLRLVNLVKWCTRIEAPVTHPTWLTSLARQTQSLSVQVERHILANHLFANGKALVFAGAFFAGDHANTWLKQGLDILDREVEEQFLPDGGHFELSPMYHASILWDMCDLANLANRCGLSEIVERVATWRGVINRGLIWLEAMCHPDGEIAFFNDAAIGIAPKPDDIRTYAAQLGCAPGAVESPVSQFQHLTDSGYIAINLGQGGKALLDVARVGPDYQPGHAHADTLSFELSLFEQRVIVNSGTSVYGTGSDRQAQRGSAMHATVVIDGEDSSEVWGGFRVARRAMVEQIKMAELDDVISLSACHDGYKRLPGSPVHCRRWEFCDHTHTLMIQDKITGRGTHSIEMVYPLHPAVSVVSMEDNIAAIEVNGHPIQIQAVSDGQFRVESSEYHPEFGLSIKNSKLVYRVSGALPLEVTTRISW